MSHLSLSSRSCRWSAFQPCTRGRRQTFVKAGAQSSVISFEDSAGKSIAFDQSLVLIGTDDKADLPISGPNCFPRHAEIRHGGGRTTCTALIGDEEDLFSNTYTWLDGDQLRKGVGYLLSPASNLAFGEPQNEYRIEFDQAKVNTSSLEMLIKGMAMQSSKEVQDNLDL